MGALGLVLTLAALALVLRGAHSHPSPPALTVRLVEARPMGDQWVAEVEVSNRGDATAASVEVEGGTAPDVASALRGIREAATEPGRVLICGSLYLAGAVLAENDSFHHRRA